MRPILSLAFLLVVALSASADPLVMTCTDRDKDGNKLDKNLRKLTIQMVHDADREKRVIQFLKTQELLDVEPWRQFEPANRKDGDVVNYVVYLTVNPNFTTFRLVTDGENRKEFVVEGHASLAGMRALSGEDFQLKSLGDPIVYERKRPRAIVP